MKIWSACLAILWLMCGVNGQQQCDVLTSAFSNNLTAAILSVSACTTSASVTIDQALTGSLDVSANTSATYPGLTVAATGTGKLPTTAAFRNFANLTLSNIEANAGLTLANIPQAYLNNFSFLPTSTVVLTLTTVGKLQILNSRFSGTITGGTTAITVQSSTFQSVRCSATGAFIIGGDVSVSNSTFDGSGTTCQSIRSTTGTTTITIAGSRFRNIVSPQTGGALQTNGNILISNSAFQNISSSGSKNGGLGLCNTAIVDSSTFNSITGTSSGGAFRINTNVVFTNSQFTDVTATAYGAVVHVPDTSFTLSTITNCTFLRTASLTQAGGVFAGPGVTFVNNTVTSASAATQGGAIAASQLPLTIIGSTFTGVTAGSANGGVIIASTKVANPLVISGSTFKNVQATNGAGGAIYAGLSNITNVTDSTFISSSAKAEGGAIWTNSPTYISNSVFQGCTASNGSTAFNPSRSIQIDNSVCFDPIGFGTLPITNPCNSTTQATDSPGCNEAYAALSCPASATRSSTTSTTSSTSTFSTTSSTTTSSTTPPSSTISLAVCAPTPTVQDADFKTVFDRRVANLILTSTAGVDVYFNNINATGAWSDVDYTTGCDGRTSSWPATVHWQRLLAMSAAWFPGGIQNQYTNSTQAYNAIILGMKFWFDRDYSQSDCVVNGGKGNCPCGTYGFWNNNWFNQIISVPKLVGGVSVLLKDNLPCYHVDACNRLMGRPFDRIDDTSVAGGSSPLTGANMLDVSYISASLGLFSNNINTLTSAFSHVSVDMAYHPTVKDDGIKPDGSFGQHSGLIHNGNYGKDYINAVVSLQLEAVGTRFQPSESSRAAFVTLIQGNEWLIRGGAQLFWDFIAVGRFLTATVYDGMATSGLNFNMTKVVAVAAQWSPDQSAAINAVADRLLTPGNSASVNPGNLIGNKAFYNADAMVHRRKDFVITYRTYSNRNINNECVNAQNPYGWHTADGALYNNINSPPGSTVVSGGQYTDIPGVWDWAKVPGTTVINGEKVGTAPLLCSTLGGGGRSNTQSFVGGVSDGMYGFGVMSLYDYYYKALLWRKAVFFFDDSYLVVISNAKPKTPASQTMSTTLDQRRRSGDVTNLTWGAKNENAIWHDGVGYVIHNGGQLTTSFANRTGDWTIVNPASRSGNTTVELFTATLAHNTSASYSVYPAQTLSDFQASSSTHQLLLDSDPLTVAYDSAPNVVMFAIWSTGRQAFTGPDGRPGYVEASVPLLAILHPDTGAVYIAEPSQSLLSGQPIAVNVSYSGKIYIAKAQIPSNIGDTAKASVQSYSIASSKYGFEPVDFTDIIPFAAKQVNKAISVINATNFPQTTSQAGDWSKGTQNTATSWGSNYIPGAAWLLYELTGSDAWFAQGQRLQEFFLSNQDRTDSHDVGMILMTTYGNGLRLTGGTNSTIKDIIVRGASSLGTRYNPDVGLMNSWSQRPNTYQVIADNMMNLELFLYAANYSGNTDFYNIAVTHARNTAKWFLRSDNSSYHVLDMSQVNGRPLVRGTQQGYSSSSTWARGHSWLVYSFAYMYEMTGLPEFLDIWKSVTNFWLSKQGPGLDGSYVPVWDFDDPSTNKTRDTSCAGAAIIGLLRGAELDGKATGTNPLNTLWFKKAHAFLSELSQPPYLNLQDTVYQSILQQGARDVPGNNQNTGISWGDYYYLEAVVRYQKLVFTYAV